MMTVTVVEAENANENDIEIGRIGLSGEAVGSWSMPTNADVDDVDDVDKPHDEEIIT